MGREEISHCIRSVQNRVDFALRGFLRCPGLPFKELSDDKQGLFEPNSDAFHRAQVLSAQYDLSSIAEHATVSRFLETLTYLDWLDVAFQSETDAWKRALAAMSMDWLDIGAKNWSYVEALTAFIQAHRSNSFQLTGLELDPYRRYLDLRTRKQYADAYIKQLPQALQEYVSYQPGNVLDWQGKANVVTHFLPFVFEEPHLAWGLSLNTFKPQQVLGHLVQALAEDGLMFIVNQGVDEAEAQQQLLAQLNTSDITVKSLGQLPVRFIEYRYPRYGWLCMKQGGNVYVQTHPDSGI